MLHGDFHPHHCSVTHNRKRVKHITIAISFLVLVEGIPCSPLSGWKKPRQLPRLVVRYRYGLMLGRPATTSDLYFRSPSKNCSLASLPPCSSLIPQPLSWGHKRRYIISQELFALLLSRTFEGIRITHHLLPHIQPHKKHQRNFLLERMTLKTALNIRRKNIHTYGLSECWFSQR